MRSSCLCFKLVGLEVCACSHHWWIAAISETILSVMLPLFEITFDTLENHLDINSVQSFGLKTGMQHLTSCNLHVLWIVIRLYGYTFYLSRKPGINSSTFLVHLMPNASRQSLVYHSLCCMVELQDLLGRDVGRLWVSNVFRLPWTWEKNMNRCKKQMYQQKISGKKQSGERHDIKEKKPVRRSHNHDDLKMIVNPVLLAV